MQKVYRVQKQSGEGPYATGYDYTLGCYPWIDSGKDPLHADKQHPAPEEDGIDNCYTLYCEGYRCGFASLDKLHAWFSAIELKRLEEMGYTIHALEAKEVVEGVKQILFLPKEVE